MGCFKRCRCLGDIYLDIVIASEEVHIMKNYLQSSIVIAEIDSFPFFIVCLTETDFPSSSITKVSVIVLPGLLGVQDTELLPLLTAFFV